MYSVAKLISKAYTYDELGQAVAAETEREIFAEVTSITRTEWAEAGRMGFNPSIRLVTPFANYSLEDEAELDGVRYAIYRTYRNGDNVELYLEKKGGVGNGSNQG